MKVLLTGALGNIGLPTRRRCSPKGMTSSPSTSNLAGLANWHPAESYRSGDR